MAVYTYTEPKLVEFVEHAPVDNGCEWRDVGTVRHMSMRHPPSLDQHRRFNIVGRHVVRINATMSTQHGDINWVNLLLSGEPKMSLVFCVTNGHHWIHMPARCYLNNGVNLRIDEITANDHMVDLECTDTSTNEQVVLRTNGLASAGPWRRLYREAWMYADEMSAMWKICYQHTQKWLI